MKRTRSSAYLLLTLLLTTVLMAAACESAPAKPWKYYGDTPVAKKTVTP